MSGDPETPPPNGLSGMTRLVSEIYLGFLAFGLLYFGTYVLDSTVVSRLRFAVGGWEPGLSVFVFAALLLVVVGVAVVGTYVRGWHRLAIGILGAYALITAVSGGVCTGWGTTERTAIINGIIGALVYVALLVVLPLALVIIAAVEAP